MGGKTNIQDLIMRALSSAEGLSIDELESRVQDALLSIESVDRKVPSKYIVRRTIKRLMDSGFITENQNNPKNIISLSTHGSTKMRRAALSNKHGVFPTQWDGRWRMVILDFDAEDKRTRDAVRYILKKANFYCIKSSVWVTPFDYTAFIEDMKYHMKLTTEALVVLAEHIDDVVERELVEYFGVSRG